MKKVKERKIRHQNGERVNFIRRGFNVIRGTPLDRIITLKFTLQKRDSMKFGSKAEANELISVTRPGFSRQVDQEYQERLKGSHSGCLGLLKWVLSGPLRVLYITWRRGLGLRVSPRGTPRPRFDSCLRDQPASR